MKKCSRCNWETNHLINGLCADCVADDGIDSQSDYERSVYDISDLPRCGDVDLLDSYKFAGELSKQNLANFLKSGTKYSREYIEYAIESCFGKEVITPKFLKTHIRAISEFIKKNFKLIEGGAELINLDTFNGGKVVDTLNIVDVGTIAVVLEES